MPADVLIIGAGASGLAAAVMCARGGKKVIVAEKEILAGRKILVTGNGRCNFTNASAEPSKYFEAAAFVKPALDNFTPKDCLAFFDSLGMLYKADEGRFFPLTGKASTVTDCFTNTLKALGAELRFKTEIVKISSEGKIFKALSADGNVLEAQNIILACGSLIYPQAGGSENGYKLAAMLGHTVTEIRPALSAVNLKEKSVSRLAGLKVNANIILQDLKGKTKDAEAGEVIFGNSGVSGNNVLSISRNAAPGDKLLIDFLPQLSGSELEAFISKRRAAFGAYTLKEFLAGILADSVINLLADYLGIRKNALINDLNQDIFARIIKTIKGWPFTVEGLRGPKEANAARGGVSLAEVDAGTMQSKKKKGLYITGELLDVDGRCGGYNLHFAWASGVLAAKSVNEG